MKNPRITLRNIWDSHNLWDRGFDYAEQGLHEIAIEHYNIALAINPNYSKALFSKANSLSELNRSEEAISCYNQAIELRPKYEKAWYNKGHTLFELKRYKEAFDCFDKLTMIKPRNKEAWQGKGFILYNEFNNYEEAIVCYDKLLKLDSSETFAWYYKGNSFLKLNKFREAILCFDNYLKQNTKNDIIINYEIWRSKAFAYVNLDCNAKAIDCLNQAIDCMQEKCSGSQFVHVDTSEQFMSNYFGMLDIYSKIIECCDEIIKIDQHNEAAWGNKVIFLDLLNMHDGAMECLNNAISVNQKSAYLLDIREKIMKNQERYEEETECYKRIAEIDSEDADAWHRKGEILSKDLGDYEEAIKCFDKVIELTPNEADGWGSKADALYLMQCYEDALKHYDKATDLQPDNERTWLCKGNIYNDLSKDADAVICYDKVIKLNQENTDAFLFLGNTMFKLERYEEALENYDRVIKLNPEDDEAWCYKGATLDTLGSYEEAIKCYEAALKIEPNSEMHRINKALSLYWLKYSDKAIECSNEIIKSNPDSFPARILNSCILCDQHNYKEALECLNKLNLTDEHSLGLFGVILCELGRFEEGIEYFNKAITINQKCSHAWACMGKAYYRLGNIQKAIQSFIQSEYDILNILIQLNVKERDEIAVHLKPILANDAFFQETTKTITHNLDDYKEAYIISMLIMSRLQITQERFVSHYTKINAMVFMLINNSKFRLSAIDNSNDPKEGITLIDYLFGKEKIVSKEEENYMAFAGCFTFNHDSLNQFRLYGKEGDKECTGVSLVFRCSFFHREIKPFVMSLPREIKPFVMSLSNENSGISKRQTEEEKLALFRCIYLDPATGFVNSIGCKEEYLFYRKHEDEREDFINEIDEYKQYTGEILGYIRAKMEELKSKTIDLSPEIIKRLLLNLRYLTKHIAFKEEQECRIVEIRRSDNNEIQIQTDEKSGKQYQYIDYLNIKSHVREIYFGPKAVNMESHEDSMRNNGLSITCKRSEHPFAL